MKLKKLISRLNYECLNFKNIEIENVTSNSKEASKNTLFICVKGERFDGHSFAKAAYEMGTRAFIAEKPLELPNDAVVIIIENSREAQSKIASIFFGEPSKKMKVIGITGTKGKTTTALMIKELLSKNNIPCGYIGSNGVQYKDVKLETTNTTPDSLQVQMYLKMMLDKGIESCVIEVSSQALVQYRVNDVTFDTTMFTNLSEDHIGQGEHASFSEYKSAKKKLFSDFSSKNIVANLDSQYTKEILGRKYKKAIFVSSESDSSSIFACNLKKVFDTEKIGTEFEIKTEIENQKIFLPMPGEFNVKNALMAIAVANIYGVSIKDCAKTLSNISIDGRFEVIKTDKDNFFVIDYAHNGLSLRSILLSLRDYNPNRLICLFGSVGGRTECRRAEMGEVANELCDFTVITSDNPDFENPMSIIKDISLPFRYNQNDKYTEIADRKEAIEYAYDMSKAGDIILLAGKGHEKYQKYMGKREYFSEREILINLIKKASAVGGNNG